MLTLLSSGLAFSPAATRVTLEPDAIPHNASTSSWRNVGAVPASYPVTLTIPLSIAKERRELLETALFDVSDPDSVNYGKHYSHDGLLALLAVPEAQVGRLRSFFGGAGALSTSLSPQGDVLTVVLPAAGAEAALQTKLAFFQHQAQPSTRLVRASASYSLPAAVADDVLMVGELLQFPRVTPPINEPPTARLGFTVPDAAAWPSSCTGCGANLLTPATLQKRYKLPATAGAHHPKNSMAVAEFQGQFFEEKDLETFSSSCSTPVDVATVVGANKSSAGVRASPPPPRLLATSSPPRHLLPASSPPPRHPAFPASPLPPVAASPPPCLPTSLPPCLPTSLPPTCHLPAPHRPPPPPPTHPLLDIEY